MIQTEIRISDDGLIEAYGQLLEQVPDFVRTITARTANRLAPQALAELRRVPGPPRYPIQFTTERQRRAYFASGGFGRGIPTQRTGRLVMGWRMQVVYSAAALTEIAFENPVPYREFVTGPRRQPFHSVTGWQSDEVVLAYYGEVFADEIETDLIKAFEAVS